jgi:hypothetical protein
MHSEEASEFPPQRGETMHINAVLEMDVVALEQDDSVTVMLDLTAPQSDQNKDRPAQAVIVVLDRSGSMSGTSTGRRQARAHRTSRSP